MSAVVVIDPQELHELIGSAVREAVRGLGGGAQRTGFVQAAVAAGLRGCSKTTLNNMLLNGEVPSWAIEQRGSRVRYHAGWCQGQVAP